MNVRKAILSVAAVIVVTTVILFILLVLSDCTPNNVSSTDNYSVDLYGSKFDFSNGASQTEVPDNSDNTGDESYGRLLSSCISIAKGGIYKISITRQKAIGGLSVPVTTTTYYGNGFINIVEYEGHDIMSEVYINNEGAYYLNADLQTAYLLSADTVNADAFNYEGLTFIESGSTNAGTSAYVYERYITSDGETIDFLFASDSLEKMKTHNEGDYELISINISTDISSARVSLPEGITVIDNRGL